MATHRLIIGGKEYVVEVGARAGDAVQVTVNGTPYMVEVQRAESPTRRAPSTARRALAPHPSAPNSGDVSGEVRAPISGVVVNVAVRPGQPLKAGALVLVLEAMKMENEIFAPVAGTVEAVLAQPQQEVRQGDILVKIQAAEGGALPE